MDSASTTSSNEDVSVSYSYDSGGLRTGKTVTTVEYVKNGLYVDTDGETRYYEDGVATYAGLVAVDGYFYYFNSSKVAVRNDDSYPISLTNDLLPAGNYSFDSEGRMYNLPEPSRNSDGSVKNGLFTDSDGELRYYVNGYASYAGLVYVGGYYYYINSSRVGVKNCSYNVSKHNDLLPAGTYTFDANGRMTNPPATASVYGVERATALATIVEDYDYIYIGSQLVQMSVSTSRNGGTATEEVLNFAYDASGMPATVSYDGVTYYYITNLQGDVLAIVDGHGATLVEYEYDPYGRLRSMSGVMSTTLGEANPLRYRGYVYDTESRLYYLQSRYYDPKVGRFINADALVSTGQGVLGFNMFAYCRNNPVRRRDVQGNIEEDCLTGDDKDDLFTHPDGGYSGSSDAISTDYPTGQQAGGSGNSAQAAGKGFSSFDALKNYLGPAGTGKHWHHIVEKCQIQKSGFSSEQVNNTSNVIAVDSQTHAKITGYYNTTSFRFTDGLNVRNWLAGQPFEVQFDFGINILRNFGVIK